MDSTMRISFFTELSTLPLDTPHALSSEHVLDHLACSLSQRKSRIYGKSRVPCPCKLFMSTAC